MLCLKCIRLLASRLTQLELSVLYYVGISSRSAGITTKELIEIAKDEDSSIASQRTDTLTAALKVLTQMNFIIANKCGRTYIYKITDDGEEALKTQDLNLEEIV